MQAAVRHMRHQWAKKPNIPGDGRNIMLNIEGVDLLLEDDIEQGLERKRYLGKP